MTTRYWKFLRADRTSPFTGHRWTPAEWASPAGQDPCRSGYHACRADDLPYWLNDELWVVELAPPVAARAHKVVAQRARLVEKVEEWTPATAREFADACVVRTAGHAADELDDGGLHDEAEHLREARTAGLSAIGELARAAATTAVDSGSPHAAMLCEYVVDAIDGIEAYPVASVAYIAARTANLRTTAQVADPYVAERRWQSTWLQERLRIR